MVTSDILVLNEMYQTITKSQCTIKAIWAEFRIGGEAKIFNLTPKQAALFASGIKPTLQKWAQHGTGEIAPELEAFISEMKVTIGYRPGIDPDILSIDVTPEGNAGSVQINADEGLTFINGTNLEFMKQADSETLQGVVDDIATRSRTIMYSVDK